MLALAAALAAVCFVKVFGTVFLGRPRRPAAADAREVGPVMLAPMAAFAAHLRPGRHPAANRARPVAAGDGAAAARQSRARLVELALARRRSAPITAPTAARHLAGGELSSRRCWCWSSIASPPTACAARRRGIAAFPTRGPRPSTPPAASPSRSAASSAPSLFAARERIDMPAPGDTRRRPVRGQPSRSRLGGHLCPGGALHLVLADRLNVLQFQTIRRYLSLMFAALVLLLLIVAVSQ